MVQASNIKLLVTAAAPQELNLSSQVHSTSIKDWITITNQKSNNAYADILLSLKISPLMILILIFVTIVTSFRLSVLTVND